MIISENILAVKNPELIEEWHPIKNVNITPYNVTFGSHKKVWWICKHNHEWEATVAHRANGTCCPYCSGRYATKETCLSHKYPTIAEEWDFERNNKSLTPDNVSYRSDKKIWWKCSKGHEFQKSVYERTSTKKSNCPYCNGKRVCSDNCLANLKPEIAKEWHPTKNGKLTPFDFTCGSGKKIWWICKNGHEWETAIINRNVGKGCHYCTNQKVYEGNSLSFHKPEIAKEWHPTKNGDLTPSDVLKNGAKKVWWKCEKGHEWQATINKRSTRSCPYCAGTYATDETSITTTNSELLKEWHPAKNQNINPREISYGSNKKVWWICKKGHEWKALVSSRVKGTGCPTCNKWRHTSFPEQAVFFYMKKLFKDSLNRYIYPESRLELDIYVPSINLGIEYDGQRYHQKKERDEKKSLYFQDKLSLIRIREKGCVSINVKDIVFEVNSNALGTLENAIKKIFAYIETNYSIKNSVEINIQKDRTEIYNMMDFIELQNSLLITNPEIAKEWNVIKNGKLKPEYVTYGSAKKVWWQCENGHEWESVINRRVNGKLCPECIPPKDSKPQKPPKVSKPQKQISVKNNIEITHPELIKEWNFEKNKILTPSKVTYGSSKKVWWKCSKGHEWEAKIEKRTIRRQRCPQCRKDQKNEQNI